MIRVAFCLATLLVVGAGSSFAAGMDATLREARLDELAGDREAAAGMYAAWLRANAGAAQAPVVLLRYLASEQNLSSLLAEGGRFLTSSARGVFVSTAFARLARLMEVAGRTEEARNAYLAAFAHGEPGSALEAAFLLSLEMNDVDALRSALAEMKDSGGERRELFDACLSLQNDDYAAAGAALRRIAGATQDSETALKALWLAYEIARRSGDSPAQREAAARLRDRFPRSPEAVMAGSSTGAPSSAPAPTVVVPLALPGSFVSGPPDSKPPAETASAPSVGPDSKQASPAGTLSVQAGSFQMKENSDDLVAELTRKGFSASVRIESQQGRQLYRVFAGSGLAAEEARALLDRLHAAGFSGFLLNDQ